MATLWMPSIALSMDCKTSSCSGAWRERERQIEADGGEKKRRESMMKEDLNLHPNATPYGTPTTNEQQKKRNSKFRLRGHGTSGGRIWGSYLTAGTVRHPTHANTNRLHYEYKSMKPTSKNLQLMRPGGRPGGPTGHHQACP